MEALLGGAVGRRRAGAFPALAAVVIPLAAITLVAFGLRVYRIGYQALTGDEAFSMLAAQRWVAGQMNLYGVGGVEPTPPLHFLVLHFWTLATGTSEFAGRYLSLIFGVLLVPTAYRLGATLGRSRLGIAAAALVAVNPLLILYSQAARSYSAVAWLSALSALFLVHLLRPKETAPPGSPSRGKTWRLSAGSGELAVWAAYVATTLLALYTHTYAAFLLVFHNVAYLLWPGRRTPLRRWAVGQAIVVALYLPWALRALGLLAAPFDVWLVRGDLPSLLFRLFEGFTLGQGDHPAGLALPAVLFGLLLFVAGVTGGWRSASSSGGRLAAAYLLAPLALSVALSLRTSFLRDRFFIPFLPGYLLGVAAGVDLLWRRRAAVGALALALCLVPAGLVLPGYYRDVQFARVADVRSLQTHLSETAKDGAAVVVNLPPSDPFFQYYDPGLPTYFVSDSQPEDRQKGLPELRRVVTEHREVWLLPFGYGDEANHFVERYLNGAAFKTEDTWFGHIRLARYAVQVAGAGQRRSADATFLHAAGKIRLAGYSLSPERPSPGDVVSLTLYWQPDGPTAKRYTVFTHLDDASGATRGQRDGEPVGGQRPTTTWRAGEEIADNYGIALPTDLPPGEYRLEVGFYQLQEGARLLLPNGENRLVLAAVQVQPR